MVKEPKTVVAEVTQPAEGAPSISEQAAALINKPNETAVAPFTPRVLKQITYPLLKQRDGEISYVEIVSKFFIGEKVDDKKDAATLAIVKTPIADGEFHFIVPAVMESELRRAFPDDGYVGHKFAVKKFKPEDGKRYNTFQILEVDWD